MKSFFNIKVIVAIFIDFLLGGLSLNLSYYIRLNFFENINLEIICASLLLPILFIFSGIYKRAWRYFSISDLWSLLKACILANIFIFVIIFIFNRLENIPRLVIILNLFVMVFFTGGVRIFYRALSEKLIFFTSGRNTRIPTLLIGGGDNADSFIRATERKNSIYIVIGIINLDTNTSKELLIRGIPVLGNIKNIEHILNKLQSDNKTPQKLVITSNRLIGTEISNIMKLVDSRGMTISRAPSPSELIEGANITSQVKDISLEDLLGRRQNKLEHSKVKNFLTNQVVLITGAGGSIGSELARTIVSFKLKKLILLDISESSIFSLAQDFKKKIKEKKINLIYCNIRNEEELEKIFIKYKPDIIYHAAALKHVFICEENPSEAIRTNIFGTHILAKLAENYKTKCFVLISTDKAVNPSSVMGATKKFAESIIQSKDRFSNYSTRFITVRFGNVLGSQGSVVPLFKKQILEGGPVTVTNKDVSRFFMTIKEAVALVLNATLEQYNSQLNLKGSVSVLNMGASIKIDILAKQMIKLAGFTPNKEIKIIYTKLQKGEKLHEALYGPGEERQDIGDKGFFLVKSKVYTEKNLNNKLDSLKKNSNYSSTKIKQSLFKLINE
jgi:O-antigen biosynthesis protein WbqV